MYDVYGRLRQGAPEVIRANAQLTASYVTTSAVDLFDFGGILVHPVVGTSAVGTAVLQHRWSLDGSTWLNETKDTVSSTTDGTYTLSVSPVLWKIDLATAGGVAPVWKQRLGRYYQAQAKWSASSAATLAINVLPATNMA